VQVLVPGLSVSKTTDNNEIVAGDDLGYTIVATNTGESDYSDITVVDSLARVLDDAVYNDDATATAGVASYAAGTLTWTGGLPRGATVVITVSVTTDLDETDDALLVNRLSSDAVGSSCPVGPGSFDPFAAPPPPGCSTSTPVAGRVITLTDLTPSFTLSGRPHTTVRSDAAVTMTVETNSPSGYIVTVTAAAAELTGAASGNTDTIPVDQLRVRESGTSAFRPLSADTPVVVHQEATPSAPGGDAVSNDYEVDIPFVAPDQYTTTLDYIVSTQ
jgi:uncharacterized repeat protein (TIGR01451 family)